MEGTCIGRNKVPEFLLFSRVFLRHLFRDPQSNLGREVFDHPVKLGVDAARPGQFGACSGRPAKPWFRPRADRCSSPEA